MRGWLVKVLGGLCLLVFLTAQSSSTPVAEAQSTGGPSQPIQVDFSGLTVEVYKSAQQQQLISSSNPAKIYDTNNPEGVASQFVVKFRGVKLKNTSGHNLTCTPTVIAKITNDASPTKVQVGSNLGSNITMANIPNGGSVEISADSLSYVPYKSGLRTPTTSETIMARTGGAGGKLEITVGNITGCGGSTFTAKAPSDNILWPALRAKVTHNVNGQQVPFANTGIQICRPNAAGLCGAGSADAGLNGFTDANGYFALALGQQPGGETNYIISTAAANGQPARSLGTKTLEDYKYYEVEVSTDDGCQQAYSQPDRKLSYLELIKQRIMPAPVLAQTPCLPDLVLDTSGLKITVTDRNGHSYTKSIKDSPAGIGYDIKKIEISGVKIKNVSTTTKATGKTCFTLLMASTVKQKYLRDCSKTQITLSLNPGQSMDAPTIAIPYGGPFEIVEAVSRIDQGEPPGNIMLMVDYEDAILESNESNNYAILDGTVITWGVIKVVLSSPVSRAVVRFKSDDKSWPERASVTNSRGVVYLAPTESLYSGSKKYRISASLGSQVITEEVPVTVNKYGITIVHLNIKDVFIINLVPKIEFVMGSPNGTILPITSGEATIQSQADNRSFTAVAKNGSVVFSSTEVKPGKYKLIKASGLYRGSSGYYKDHPLSFQWPEKSRNETGGLEINYKTGTAISRTMLLGKSCGSLVSPGLTYCVYNDAPARKIIVENNVPIARQVLTRMLNWPSFAPKALKEYTYSPNPISDYGAYLSNYPKKDPLLVVHKSDKYYQREITYHEVFHLIDFYGTDSKPAGLAITSSLDYQRSIDFQLSSKTGRKLWDHYLPPGAYGFDGGYSARSLVEEGSGKYSEAFAEEKSTTCVLKQEMIDRLENATTNWQSLVSEPPPKDLIIQRDNALNRLKGLLPDKNGRLVKNEAIATLHQQCLTK